jgi:hypothetical protein
VERVWERVGFHDHNRSCMVKNSLSSAASRSRSQDESPYYSPLMLNTRFSYAGRLGEPLEIGDGDGPK